MDHESDNDQNPHSTFQMQDGEGNVVAVAHIAVDPENQEVSRLLGGMCYAELTNI